jgi:hypothetical protein
MEQRFGPPVPLQYGPSSGATRIAYPQYVQTPPHRGLRLESGRGEQEMPPPGEGEQQARFPGPPPPYLRPGGQ